MGFSIGGVTISGQVKGYTLSSAPGIFEGTNTNLVLPISFAGSPNTFTASVQNDLPISFEQSTTNPFISTNDTLELPLSFQGNASGVLTSSTESTLPITFSGEVFVSDNSSYTKLFIQGDEGTNGSTANALTVGTYNTSLNTTFSNNRFKYSSEGESLFFNTGYLDVTQTDFSATQTPWTFEAWVYPTSVTSRVVFVVGAVTDSDGYGTARVDFNSSGQLTLLVSNTGVGWTYNISSSASRSANQWYHIALVRDNAGVIKLYVNGIQDITTGASVSPQKRNRHYLGACPAPGGGFATSPGRFQGNMEDVRYKDGIALYTLNFTPPSGSLTL